jgi:hypothetical protein
MKIKYLAMAIAISPMVHAGQWTFSVPIHAPSLNINDGASHTDVEDLFDLASEWLALGVEYEFDNGDFIRYNGWYGRYGDNGESREVINHDYDFGGLIIGFPRKQGTIVGDSDFNFDMKQAIQSAEYGVKVYDDSIFKIHVTAGVRNYKQKLNFYGNLDGLITPKGTDKDIIIIDRDWDVGMTLDWTEFTAGINAEAAMWSKGSIDTYISYGSSGSYRWEVAYKQEFNDSWYGRFGYRMDYIKSESELFTVDVKEGGALLEIAYSF